MDERKPVDQFFDLLQNFIHNLIEILPKLVFGIFVLLLGFLLARVIQFLIKRLIRYVNKVINEKLKSKYLKIDLEGSETFVSKTIYWIVLIFFFTLFTEIVGLPVITTWLGELVQYMPNILAAIVIVIAGIILGRLLADIFSAAAARTGLAYGDILGKVTRYAVLLISIVIAIDQVGIDIGFLINLVSIVLAAILFGACLAFGLGARTSVSNILASYYIQKMFREGDTIRIGDQEGKIVKITVTSVIIAANDGHVIIPAKEFSETRIVIVKKDS